MNNQIVSQYNEYLKLTGGDKAAAASLALAATLWALAQRRRAHIKCDNSAKT